MMRSSANASRVEVHGDGRADDTMVTIVGWHFEPKADFVYILRITVPPSRSRSKSRFFANNQDLGSEVSGFRKKACQEVPLHRHAHLHRVVLFSAR